jgi:hypothetical protein
MKRRSFLKIAATSAIVPFTPSGCDNVYSGWEPPQNDFGIKRFPEQMATKEAILLYKFLEAATQRMFVPHNQETVDCTSHATALAIDIAQAVQVSLGNDRWVKSIATELLHIGGREIVGGRRRGGVAIGEAVKFASDYGNLFRVIYPGWDFTTYSLSNINEIDRKSTKELKLLLEEAGFHPIIESYRVNSAAQAYAALSNFHPVVLGSHTAFGKNRDKDGFVRPTRGSWSHAWTLIGFDTRFKRPGALLMSSWGKNWVSGPKRNQPDGSIWVDTEVLDRMLGEAIAIQSFKGWRR